MLTKISDVRLFIGITNPGLEECYACRDILDQENIPYTTLTYGVESDYLEHFEILSNHPFAPAGDTRTITSFPVILWKEFDDDVEGLTWCVTNAVELQSSSLITNKGLVI